MQGVRLILVHYQILDLEANASTTRLGLLASAVILTLLWIIQHEVGGGPATIIRKLSKSRVAPLSSSSALSRRCCH